MIINHRPTCSFSGSQKTAPAEERRSMPRESKEKFWAMKKPEDNHFLEHPDVKVLFNEVLPELIAESDRGAVIVGADVVDSQLRILFEKLMSKSISNKRKKSLFDYPGPLSTFSAKTDVALAVGYIGERIYNCVQALRRIRNEAAHSNKNFNFSSISQELRKMYNLGEGVPIGINRWALDFMMHTFIENTLFNTRKLKDELGKVPFETPREVIDYIANKPDLLKPLEEKLPRYEFALGLIMLCAMIVFERDRAVKKKKH